MCAKGCHIINSRTIVLRLAAVAFVFGEFAKREDVDVGKAREIVYDSLLALCLVNATVILLVPPENDERRIPSEAAKYKNVNTVVNVH